MHCIPSLQKQITTQIDQIRDEVIQQKDVELQQDDELQLKDIEYRGCQDMIRQMNVCTI